ncbi:MAG TPA: hypothetical protein VM580_01710 [Labilithrix sp.]|jgi:hypothetical protein|nr:hypothetical protein [Labilithrix sp.]
MILGRIDEVDGHYIGTRFILCLPIGSVYVAPRKLGSSVDRLSIRPDGRSIALAYGRVWLPLLAIGLLALQAVSDRIHFATWGATIAMLAISVASHRAGRLPETEKARLRLLGTATGFRIDPSKLKQQTRETKRDSLGELMEKGGLPMTPDGILSVLDEIPLPALPLVYGYACYAGDTPEWRTCAVLVQKRYEQVEM